MISHEEEELVLLDWAAKGPAELVLVQHRLWCTRRGRGIKEIVVSVQRGVPEKFKSASVKVIRAGLGDDVDVGAGIAAVAGVIV